MTTFRQRLITKQTKQNIFVLKLKPFAEFYVFVVKNDDFCWNFFCQGIKNFSCYVANLK